MKLKNYESSSPMPSIFAAINTTLVTHGARQIAYDYAKDGRIVGIMFIIDYKTGTLPIRLPARFDRVEQIFKDQGIRYKPEQPYRTAWATIRDWVSAQMALIDWEMVKLEEVFLPYAVSKNGQTYFEVMQNKGFQLESGAEEGTVE